MTGYLIKEIKNESTFYKPNISYFYNNKKLNIKRVYNLTNLDLK